MISQLTDINECELGVDTCHESATCSDVEDVSVVTVSLGYTGNGTICVLGELTVVTAFMLEYMHIVCKQILPLCKHVHYKYTIVLFGSVVV